MRGKIFWSQSQSRSVERNRVNASYLPMRYGGTFIRQTALNPQPRVVRIGLQRVANGFAIGDILVRIPVAFQIIQLTVANHNPHLFALVELWRQFLRAPKGGARCGRVMQSDIGVGQAEKGHGQIGVQAQGLMKGADCVDPDERMSVRHALIVKGLGLLRGGCHFFV